ncbi:DUF1906 domain-containing protein [Actinomadura fibrosa]|uniref:DUF1906 domain-containing protein n=1 Tax=Actinomadura fibrosa TaxID=111802 RepID=A0ABW2XJF8_9ACTN|nr:DUF1906 domain-containing protein [Actinomadura fibrosa]
MRHAVLLSGISGVAAAAPLVAGLGPAAARTPPDAPAALIRPAPPRSAPPRDAPRVVHYRGVRVPVPPGWEVHRLDRHPARCVRYDRHAVYLGRPGAQPDCPARVVGRTEALHVVPLGAGRTSRTAVQGDKLAGLDVRPSTGQETTVRLPEAGVTIIGVYGTDRALLERTIRATRLTPNWPAGSGGAKPGGAATAPKHAAQPNGAASGGPVEPARRKAEADPDPTLPGFPWLTPPSGIDDPDEPAGAGPGQPSGGPPPPLPPDGQAGVEGPDEQTNWATGKGFDTCTAPSLAAMRAWRPSFDVTNIYIGGAARGCAQPNLTASWVREVRRMGYRITPTYVGLQAPCGRRPQRFTRRNAAAKGAAAAADAARRADALGIPPGMPVYLDMEAYRSRKASCRKAVLRFVDAWVRALEARNYQPCMYSSASSGMRDVGWATGISKPGCIWFADWDGRAQAYGDPYLPDRWWPPHRRIKQYRGGHRERHGGVTINIDSNYVDGRVY